MNKKNFLVKILVYLISVILLFSFISCSNEGSIDNGGTNNQNKIEIWTANITDKILQDKIYGENIKSKSDFEITIVKGEVEGGQIILTPIKDVLNYKIEINDLKNSNDKILKKECFKVYNQKYINVVAGSDGSSPTSSSGIGIYPDAILPMEKAIEYGENCIKAGQNQGIYIDCKVSEEQEAGIYSGNFKIIIDNSEYIINAKCNVIDYNLSSKVTAKSCFMTNRGYLGYGGDSTIEMYEKYYDFLLDHRVAAFELPCISCEIDSYIETVAKYTKDDRCPSIAIPQFTIFDSQVGDMDIDKDKIEEYMYKMAIYSVENDINLFEKTFFHFGTIIDEPDLSGLESRAKRVSKNVENLKNEVVNKIQNGEIKNNNGVALEGVMVDKIISSIKKMPHPVTSEYTDDLYNNGNGVLNYCPQFSKIDLQKLKELGNEYWWYGCIGPQNPYPTYHIDDKLVTSRILSWMQKDYGVAGNLYWETLFWFNYNSQTGARETIEDLYSNPMRYPGCNGDGFLLYPGQPYGIDGPVGSIRLSAIRDGLEEYEILADLENGYKEVGLDYNDITQQMYTEMYDEARVRCDSDVYMQNRIQLYQLGALMQNFNTYIVEKKDSDSYRHFIIKSKADEIYVNNKKQTMTKEQEGYKIFDIQCKDNEAYGNLSIEVKLDGKTSNLSYNLGGKTIEIIPINSIDNMDNFKISGGTKSYIENAQSDYNISGGAIKFDMNKGEKLIQYEGNELKNLNNKASKLICQIYNIGETQINIKVSIKGKNNDVFEYLGTLELKHGLNRIEISNLSSLNWNSMGEINAIKFSIESLNSESIIFGTTYIKEK